MMSLRWGAHVCAIAIFAGALTTACHPTFVVLPGPESDSAGDTLAHQAGEEHFPEAGDVRVDTVVRIDTVFRTRTLVHRDTVTRVDTVVRVDTFRIPFDRPVVHVDTVTRTDTLRLTVADTLVVVDTVRTVVEVPVATVDTVVVTDTVRVAGRRFLFLPPGHYPPEGQCRVWIHGEPPGQQAKAAPCEALGPIPAGAFILFAGDAWDFDYDWLTESTASPGTVPPEIVALQQGHPGPVRAESPARGRDRASGR
jgi:hypothetical protein